MTKLVIFVEISKFCANNIGPISAVSLIFYVMTDVIVWQIFTTFAPDE